MACWPRLFWRKFRTFTQRQRIKTQAEFVTSQAPRALGRSSVSLGPKGEPYRPCEVKASSRRGPTMWFTSPTLQVEKHAGHGWGASGQKILKVTAHDMERFFSQ